MLVIQPDTYHPVLTENMTIYQEVTVTIFIQIVAHVSQLYFHSNGTVTRISMIPDIWTQHKNMLFILGSTFEVL